MKTYVGRPKRTADSLRPLRFPHARMRVRKMAIRALYLFSSGKAEVMAAAPAQEALL